VTRRAWIYVTTGYVCMAVGFIVFGFILNHEVNRISQTQKYLGTAVVHNAGAICLGLTAPSKAAEMAIVESFLKDHGATIAKQFTPICRAAAAKAAHDIFDHNLPPGVDAIVHHPESRGVG